MSDYDVIVVGSGLGGLTAASQLQNKGFKTLVVEHCDQIGGCCGTLEVGDYKFDTGPSVVELQFVIDRVFENIGRKREDYIEWLDIDPIYGFVDHNGQHFSYPVSIEGTRKVIENFSEEDAKAWDRFAELGQNALEKAFNQVMTAPMTSFAAASSVMVKNPAVMKYMAPYLVKSFEQVLTGFFKDPAVVSSMCLQSYFVGLPPCLAPGYIAFLAYSEHDGIVYPKGGMDMIPKGIAKAFEEDGGEIRLNSTVSKILTEGKRVTGIELRDGTQISANMVVTNVNAKVVYEDMLGKDRIPGWAYKGIKSYEVSIPAPMIMLGVDNKPDLECHHTFCHSSLDNMNSIWFDNFKSNKLLGDKNFMLICTPSLSDDSLAPKGHHTLNLVSFSPYEPVEGDWDKGLREQYLEDILDLMQSKFGLDLRSNLKVAEVIDPKRFERRFLHPRGAVYGLQQDLFNSAMFRPNMKSRVFKGLYLTGASTHLGGGVPPTIGSGIAASQMVLKDCG